MKKQAFFILLLLISQLVLAQYQNMNWFFGNGTKLKFSTDPPTASINGQIANNNNSVTYSDPLTGQLEFYTDGHYIYNYNHNVIQGSQDDFPGDDVVSVLICPYPNHNEKYFVFTTARQHRQTKFYYSVVDMMGNNGLGTVNVLNEPMPGLPANAGSYYIGSNQVIVKHADGQSYWILTTVENLIIYSSLINGNGISNTPVINDLHHVSGLKGVLAVSPDTEFLIYIGSDGVVGTENNRSSNSLLSMKPILSTFDNSTGNVDLDFTEDYYTNFSGEITSIEFVFDQSTNTLLVYLLNIGDNYTDISQYSVLYNSYQQPYLYSNYYISGNRYYPTNDDDVNLPCIRKGMDGKLYFMNLDSGNLGLSVINNPNLIGARCGYSQNIVDLQGHDSYNLPVNVDPEYFCIENWVEYNNYTYGDYIVINTSNNITAYNTVESGARGEFRAGNSIDLKPGFSALAGSDFLAIIEDCNVSFNNFNENDLYHENIKINNDDELKTIVYPNPVKEVLTIKSKNQILGIKLTNKSGEIFFESNQIAKKQVELNITPYQKGLYFLKIILRDKTLIKKIIIE